MRSAARSVWLDQRTVEQVTGWSVRTILSKAKSNKLRWRYRPGLERGRNGRRVREFCAWSLPAEAQAKFGQFIQARMAARKPEEPLSLVPDAASHNSQITLFPLAPKFPARQRTALPPEQREQADHRLEVIKALLDFKQRTNGHRPTFRCQDGRNIRTLAELAGYVAEQRETSPATVWRWYCRFQKLGYPGLADEPRRDKGESRFFAAHPEIAALARQKYLNERLSVQLVYETIKARCNGDTPGYSTVLHFLKTLPGPIVTLARDGERAFGEKCAPFLCRDFGSIRPNQVWVSDHGVHDVWVRNDEYFPGVPTNAAIRVWLTAIEDMRTRKIVGATWCATPSSHTIGSALRQALLRYGAPETFYMDNGKEFLKVGRIDFSPETLGILHRLDIKPQYCLPKHPQSKLIESWFRTVRTRFDMTYRPFWCGNKPSNRPDECAEVLKEHEALVKAGRGERSPLLPASQFVREARFFVEQQYNAEFRHSGRGMSDRRPNEVFDELLPADARRPVDASTLDVLLWDREKRTVSEGGCIELFGTRYEPADQESGSTLFLEIGHAIMVCCDPDNLGEAVALDLDGHFLGRLRSQKLIAHGPTSHQDIKASMVLRRRLLRATRECLDLVGFHAASVGDMTETQRRRLRAGEAPRRAGLSPRQLPARGASSAQPAYIDDVVAEFAPLMQDDNRDTYTGDLVDEVAALMEDDNGTES